MNVDAFLEHHGIKGQKWGVRRQEFNAAKASLNNVDSMIRAKKTKQSAEATLNDQSFKRLSNKDFVVKKGSVIKRTSSNPSNKEDHVFVSTNEADARNYRALAPMWAKGGVVSKKHENFYETTFKATNDLKSPSDRKRVEGYIHLMDQTSIKLANGETINGKEYLRRQGLGNIVDTLSTRNLALKYYGQIVYSQGIKDEPLHTAYFNAMKKKGYNALIDDNDRGVLAKTPLLVLNSKVDLATVEIRQLSTSDVHRAQANLKLPDAA